MNSEKEFIDEHSKKVGLPPGILTDEFLSESKIKWIHYNNSGIISEEDVHGYSFPKIEDSGTQWLHIQGTPSNETLSFLNSKGIHLLSLEDVQGSYQRPKVEEHDEYLFIVLNFINYKNSELKLEQVSLFLFDNLLISVHKGDSNLTESIYHRIHRDIKTYSSLGTLFLCYTIIDFLVDNIFPALENIGEDFNALESQIAIDPQPDDMMKIQKAKKLTLMLKRQVWPVRELISYLQKFYSGCDHVEMKPYLSDVYDHVIEIIDILESFRDLTSGLIDLHMSANANKLNDVMKILTIITVLFAPMTFIAGLYGMNFISNTSSPWAMPEIHWYYGYPFALGLMLLSSMIMLIFFKKKKWIFQKKNK